MLPERRLECLPPGIRSEPSGIPGWWALTGAANAPSIGREPGERGRATDEPEAVAGRLVGVMDARTWVTLAVAVSVPLALKLLMRPRPVGGSGPPERRLYRIRPVIRALLLCGALMAPACCLLLAHDGRAHASNVAVFGFLGFASLVGGLAFVRAMWRANIVLDGESFRMTIVGGNEWVRYEHIQDVVVYGGHVRIELVSGQKLTILPYFENIPEIAATLFAHVRNRQSIAESVNMQIPGEVPRAQ